MGTRAGLGALPRRDVSSAEVRRRSLVFGAEGEGSARTLAASTRALSPERLAGAVAPGDGGVCLLCCAATLPRPPDGPEGGEGGGGEWDARGAADGVGVVLRAMEVAWFAFGAADAAELDARLAAYYNKYVVRRLRLLVPGAERALRAEDARRGRPPRELRWVRSPGARAGEERFVSAYLVELPPGMVANHFTHHAVAAAGALPGATLADAAAVVERATRLPVT